MNCSKWLVATFWRMQLSNLWYSYSQPALYNSWNIHKTTKILLWKKISRKCSCKKNLTSFCIELSQFQGQRWHTFFSLFSFLSYWRQNIYSLYLLYGGKSQEELWLKNLIGCWLGQEPPSKKWGDILADFSIWVGGW